MKKDVVAGINKIGIKNSVSSSYHRFVKRGLSGITASSRVLPNFIIIGTVRSGSTSLYYNICEHSAVLSADPSSTTTTFPYNNDVLIIFAIVFSSL